MSRLKWLKSREAAQAVGAFFLGTVAVGLCMLFIDRDWVERFQGLMGAGAAIAAAMWTISVTILHREQDKFSDDRHGLMSVLSSLQIFKFPGEPGGPVNFPQSVGNMPITAFYDYNTLAGIKRLLADRTAFSKEDYSAYEDCVVYFIGWINQCLYEGRYVTFKHDHDIKKVFSIMLRRPFRQEVVDALMADN